MRLIGRVGSVAFFYFRSHADSLEIRAAILDGDIDKALKHTNAYYANVLQDNPHILFKLRCRKFIEMMRRCNELSVSHSKRSRSANGAAEESVFDQYMDVDDQAVDDTDGMDTEESDSTAKFQELLTEAVQYGQQLRMDYPTEERGGDSKLLDDIFSLVAYSDPKSSVHGHYLDPAGRVAVAEELNSAILGKFSTSCHSTRVTGLLTRQQCRWANRHRPRWSGYTSRRKCSSTKSVKKAALGRLSMYGMISCSEARSVWDMGNRSFSFTSFHFLLFVTYTGACTRR